MLERCVPSCIKHVAHDKLFRALTNMQVWSCSGCLRHGWLQLHLQHRCWLHACMLATNCCCSLVMRLVVFNGVALREYLAGGGTMGGMSG